MKINLGIIKINQGLLLGKINIYSFIMKKYQQSSAQTSFLFDNYCRYYCYPLQNCMCK